MAEERCPNNNHSRMNVSVRFCPQCGGVVGKNIAIKTCSAEDHARYKKDRSKFCIDCGKNLLASPPRR